MLVLEIFKTVHHKRVTKKDGTESTIYFQEAEVKRGKKRPKVVEISSKKGQSYPAGYYTVDGESYGPDDFDRLSLSRYFKLQALDDAILIATEYEKITQKT